MTTTEHPVTVLRPLGVFESLFQRFRRVGSATTCTVVELGAVIDEARVAPVLAELARIHPLLAAVVHGDAEGFAYFRAGDQPVPLHTHTPGESWHDHVTAMQTAPFAMTDGPLSRVDLFPIASGTTVVVSIDHQIADGGGVTRLVRDFVGLLGGDSVAPQYVPESVEALVGAMPAGFRAIADPPADGPVAVTAHAAIHVFSVEDTDRIRRACWANGVTVTAALVTATLRISGKDRDRRLRFCVPVDLRRHLGLPDAVALRMTPIILEFDHRSADPFWDTARRIGRLVEDALSPSSLAAAVAAGASADTGGADGGSEFMAVDFALSNIGAVDIPAVGDVLVRELHPPLYAPPPAWDPGIVVLAFGGRLRMSYTTSGSPGTLLDDVADAVLSAAG